MSSHRLRDNICTRQNTFSENTAWRNHLDISRDAIPGNTSTMVVLEFWMSLAIPSYIRPDEIYKTNEF